MRRYMVAFLILIISTIYGGDSLSDERLGFFDSPAGDSTILLTERIGVSLILAGSATYLTFSHMDEVWGRDTGNFHFKTDFTGDGLYLNDEISHMIISYKLAQASFGLSKWTGVSRKYSYWLGAVMAFLWMTGVEFPIDAYNPKQGFGISDFIFNNMGIALALLRESSEYSKRFDLKLSYADLANYPSTIVAWNKEEYNNFEYWLTWQPYPEKMPINVGLGYSTQWRDKEARTLKPEFLIGAGISLADLQPIIGKRWARKLDVLGFYNFNLHISLN